MCMEYQSTQYKAGHMTQDMETVTIKKEEKEQMIVSTIMETAYNQPK